VFVDNGLATALPNLKSFKEKNKIIKKNSFFGKFLSRSAGPMRSRHY
jgi:hypothetical protein